jgi:hypothetical protein
MDQNPDPGGPKTYGSHGSGFESATLQKTRRKCKYSLEVGLPVDLLASDLGCLLLEYRGRCEIFSLMREERATVNYHYF